MSEASKNFRFQEMSLDELRQLKKKLTAEKGNDELLARLNTYAQIKIQEYLNGSFTIQGIEAPAFLAFINAFGKNGKKPSDTATKAIHKLMPELKAFDAQNGLAGIESVPEEQLLKNIEVLDELASLNPFMTDKNGQSMKYPAFQKAAKVLKAIKITDDDGSYLDEAEQKSFRTTLLETARLETYLHLSGGFETPTENIYLNHLRETLETNLINLLTTDKIIKEYPLSEVNRKKLYEDFEKLTAAFS